MEKWLKTLEALLLKKYDQQEVDIVIDYYKEMISERVERGENIDDVLASYQMKIILKDMMVDHLAKRKVTNTKDFVKSLIQFFLILITTPLWIPFAIVYFVLFLVLAILIVVSGSLLVAGIVSVIFYGIQAFGQSFSAMEIAGYMGLILISASLLGLIGVSLYRLSERSAKMLYGVFLKLVRKDRGV